MAQDSHRADRPFALRARYVLPIAGPPIRNGSVTIHAGRIVAVGTNAGDGHVQDLGNVALLPGLINAHTHLDLSNVASPLGRPGMAFTAWIREVIRSRKECADLLKGAIERGIAESTRHGVTSVADIAQAWWPGECGALSQEVTTFREVIAPTRERIPDARSAAREFLNESRMLERVTLGLSPHAPYTVHWEVLDEIVRWSREAHFPLAMHLAETREEVEFLNTGAGPFRDLLVELNTWDSHIRGPAQRPLDYLTELAKSSRVLVIHGNYLDDEETTLLGAHSDRMAVVYCPRTHAYFGHDAYPLSRTLDAGVCVAIGTDSRASNPDLSILAELRFVARNHGSVSPQRILDLGTLGGAAALGRRDQLGSLGSGKIANLTAVELPEHDAEDPHELILGDSGDIVGTWFHGRRVLG